MKQVCRREREREGAAVAPSGRTVVGVATCGGASGRRAGGSVAWRLERWRERERERERDSKKREKQGREAGFLAEFEPNLLPIFTEKKFQPLILLVRIPTIDSK